MICSWSVQVAQVWD